MRGDPTLTVDPDMPRHQQRVIRAVGPVVDRVIMKNEEVLAISEAIEETPLMTRAVLGALWARSRRVALLFTTRRLMEIGISASGRRSLGRVRTFPWDGIPSIQIVDDWLEIRSWSGETYRWYLHDPPDPALEGRLNRRVNLAVSTFVPSDSRTAPLHHCSRCGAERPAAEPTCRHCDAVVRSPALAGSLAAAIPGAGHLFCGRPVAACVRLLAETAVFGLLAFGVLSTTDVWRTLAIVAVGFGLLSVIKLHGVWSARVLAERAGVVAPRAHTRWRWLVPLGAAVSIAVLLAPLFLRGTLDQRVTWDLTLIDSRGEWRRLAPEPAEDGAIDQSIRSVWSHSSGRRITIRARPMAPLTSVSQAEAEATSRSVPPHVANLVGDFTVFRLLAEPSTAGVLITHRVVDRVGRDVHDVSVAAGVDDERQARQFVTSFLEHCIWTRAED
jgi:hypothetical protein